MTLPLSGPLMPPLDSPLEDPDSQLPVPSGNAAPVLGAVESSALSWTEGDGATAITSTITVSDADDTNLTSGVVQIASNYDSGNDVLAFVDQLGITGSWNSGTGVMSLSGTTTKANYQTALRAVTFDNTSQDPSGLTRTVSFRVSDGTDLSNTANRQIDVTPVNDAPVASGMQSGSLAYTEGDAATAITNSFTITDVDDTHMDSATVQITGSYESGADVLSFADTANITGSWDSGSGTMTLSGSDTIANYELALESVKYSNTSDNPSALTRTVTFTVNDGSDDSNSLTRDIAFTAVNDPPALSGVPGTDLAYTEGDGAVAIALAIVVADVDDTNMASATVTISGNYQNGQDVLAGGGGSFDAPSGVLTLSGSDTIANYQANLRAVTFENTSQNPSTATRTISFQVNDGTDNSVAVTRDITITAVNDAPTVGNAGATLAYTEGDAATVVSSSLVVTDPDSVNLSSATVQITSNYASGEDVLSFVDTGNISGSWVSGTGKMTLTGNDTVANYQAALRAVKYENTSNNPSTSTRTVTFKAHDGTDESTGATRDISITAVNDKPVISDWESSPMLFAEGDVPTAISSALIVVDDDNTNLASATIQLTTGYENGEDVLVYPVQIGSITGTWTAATGTMALSGSDTVANYQSAIRSVQFDNNAAPITTGTRTISLSCNDGTDDSDTVTRDVTVVGGSGDLIASTGDGFSVEFNASGEVQSIKDGATTLAKHSTQQGGFYLRDFGANFGDPVAQVGNGDFESGALDGGWSKSGTGSASVVNSGGDHYLHMDATVAGVSVTQTIAAEVGHTYTIRFRYRMGGSGTRWFGITPVGATFHKWQAVDPRRPIARQTWLSSASAGSWTEFSTTVFTDEGCTSLKLEFVLYNQSAGTYFDVDDVTVEDYDVEGTRMTQTFSPGVGGEIDVSASGQNTTVTATITEQSNHLLVEGTLTSTDAPLIDRALGLEFCVPLDQTGLLFGRNADETRAAPSDPEDIDIFYETRPVVGRADWKMVTMPCHSLSDGINGVGLGFGVDPPQHGMVYRKGEWLMDQVPHRLPPQPQHSQLQVCCLPAG